MERRDLLRSAALGVTLALLPPWMRHAFAADECDPDSVRFVRDALDRAHVRGLPLLVFVVPATQKQRGERGRFFGELVDLGPTIALASLALAEVVCASVTAVRCVEPATPAPGDYPPMFLIIDAGPDRIVTPLHVEIHPMEWPEDRLTPDEQIADWRRQTKHHTRCMTSALHGELAGPALARRAQRNFAALAVADRQRIVAAAHDGGAGLPADLVERGAPTLLASALATHLGEARRRAYARLAAVGRRRVRERAPAGGRWSRLDGCGEYAHHGRDDEVGGMDCGLGSIPVRSARFLTFHTAGAS